MKLYQKQNPHTAKLTLIGFILWVKKKNNINDD